MTDDPVSLSTRDAVLEAARRVIAEVGLDELRLRDVTKESGLSTGAIYAHFTSRADLAAAVAIEDFRSYAAELTAAAAALNDAPTIDFRAVLRNFFAPDVMTRRQLWVTFLVGSSHSPEIQQEAVVTVAALHDALTMLVSKAVAFGQLRPGVDPEDAAMLMRICAAGLTVFRIPGVRPQDQDGIERMLADYLLIPETVAATTAD